MGDAHFQFHSIQFSIGKKETNSVSRSRQATTLMCHSGSIITDVPHSPELD